MRTCSACGAQCAAEAAFCAVCGAQLKSSSGERRQITVLFCDLVGSTKLSTQLDAEELQELLKAYFQVCEQAVQRYGGHTAQVLGDGVLVYFGYPQAHEDDPERALRAALDIVSELKRQAPLMERRWDVPVATRIGVHTGLVVVGDMGVGQARQKLATGETTNVAARLEGEAPIGGVVASDATLNLVHDKFHTRAREPVLLKGIAEPMVVHEVIAARELSTRFDATVAPLPLVGREQEYATLLGALERARNGQGEVVLVRGDPGIGKSRLASELNSREFSDTTHGWLSLQCVAHEVTRPFSPVIRGLRHNLFPSKLDLTSLHETLEALDLASPTAIELLAPHFGLSSMPELTVSWSKKLHLRKTIEILSELLLASLDPQVGVLELEDVHWADASTRDLIDRLAEITSGRRRLVILTARPEFTMDTGVKTYIELRGLDKEQTGKLVELVAQGRKISPSLIALVAERSDGVPLFTEQVTHSFLEQGENLEAHAPSDMVPRTLQDLLNARLDRMGSSREVAQKLSVLGREFQSDWAAIVCATVGDLEANIATLVHASLLERRGTSLRFKHALIQEAAYSTLLHRDRKTLHSAFAKALTESLREVGSEHPELLAHHWAEAGENENAVDAWLLAAPQALLRNALRESGVALEKALSLLGGIENAEARDNREFSIRFALNFVMIAEVPPASEKYLENNVRALELVRSAEDPRGIYVRLSIATSQLARGNLVEAASVYKAAIDQSASIPIPVVTSVTHFAYSRALLYRGQFEGVIEHALTAQDLWPENHPHLGGPGMAVVPVDAQLLHGVALWHTGFPDKALAKVGQARLDADAVQEPSGSVQWSRVYCAWVKLLCGDLQAAFNDAEEGLARAAETGEVTTGLLFQQIIAWVHCETKPGVESAAAVETLARSKINLGHLLMASYDLGYAGTTYGHAGDAAKGLVLVEEGITLAKRCDENYAYPELLRMRAALNYQLTKDRVQAKADFSRAVEVASELGMWSWALRSATDLARIAVEEQDPSVADALKSVFARFSEGHRTRDLLEATAVLESLSQ